MTIKKALSGARGEVVEVYLNDEYKGIYCFTQCIDRKQLKQKKFDNDGTIHGTLWKSTGFGSSLMNSLPDSYDNSQAMNLPVVLDYYLFINLLGAIDNTGKNMYWAVYDKQKEKNKNGLVIVIFMDMKSIISSTEKKFSSNKKDAGD